MKKLLAALALVCLPVGVYAQGLPLKDGVASTLATISSCGTPNCVSVVTPTAPASAGLTGIVGTTGAPSSSTTTGRNNRAYVTEGNKLAVAHDTYLFDDTFNATAQNTSVYRFAGANYVGAQATGFYSSNSTGLNGINSNSALQTFRTFPLYGKAELRAHFSALKTVVPQANETYEIGLMSAVLPGAAVPTDGCFFRWNTAAELRGICTFNTLETTTVALTSPSINVNHDYLIVIQTNTVLFYIDDVLTGTITLTTDAPTQGQPLLQATVPLTIRHYVGAVAPAVASAIRVTDVFVSSLGPDLGKTWSDTKAGMGNMGYQGQNGGTMGTTANTLNGATPAAAALTNTAISTGSPVGLGGVAHVLPTLTVGTDGILFSFQNPTGGVNQTPRNLVIRGVNISGGVDLVLTGGPLVLVYSLAYGHTAISLATVESTTFVLPGPTVKAPRRVWLGVHSTVITAAAGTALGPAPIAVKFDGGPIVVAPGEFVAITVRNQGIVTTLGSVIIAAAFDAYFE